MMRNVLLALGLALCTGCMSQVGYFTVYSTDDMKLDRELHKIDYRNPVQGKSVRYVLLGIPLGSLTIDEAFCEAKSQANGCVGLANVSLFYGDWKDWGIFLNRNCYEISGYPIYKK